MLRTAIADSLVTIPSFFKYMVSSVIRLLTSTYRIIVLIGGSRPLIRRGGIGAIHRDRSPGIL